MHFGPHFGMELDPDLVFTQLANRLRQIDLALVHVDPQLLELTLDVARRDGPVQLLLFTDLHLEAELGLGQARGFGLRRRLLRGVVHRGAMSFVWYPCVVRHPRWHEELDWMGA